MNPLKLAGLAGAGITVAAMVAAAPAHAAATAAKLPATAVPAFTVASTGSSGTALTIYRTGTKTKVASISAPSSLQFGQVASGGTTGSFLASVTTQYPQPCHAWFYKFTIGPTGRPSKLTLLRSIAGSLPTAIAASPGGGTIAYSAVTCATAGPRAWNTPIGKITTITKTGSKSWSYTLGEDYPDSLAVSATGGTLAFPGYTGTQANPVEGAFVLNTASKSTTVLGASKILLRTGSPDPITISADGKTFYAHTLTGTKNAIAAYSASTGKLTKVLRSWTSTNRAGLSSDATGSYMLITIVSVASGLQVNSLTGYNLATGAVTKLPTLTSSLQEGNQVAW